MVGLELPRLVIASDVPVDLGGGGSILLYRLFKEYPQDKLLILQPGPDSRDFKRLAGVTYRELTYKVPRIFRNRLNPFWPPMMAKWIERRAGEIIATFQAFSGEAILTVPHGFIWIAAAKAAESLGCPLHLVVHDDWPSLITFRKEGKVQDLVRRICSKQLGKVYRQAVSRMCVSPGMEEKYRAFFGQKGEVIYPTVGADSPDWADRIGRADKLQPGIGFCGMIHHNGVMELLAKLTTELKRISGCLHLFTTLTREYLIQRGLDGEAIRVHGFLPARELGDRVASCCHALILPGSFQKQEKLDTETLFPSKLADYCSMGLPVICWAPEYSSAFRWFKERELLEWASSGIEPDGVMAIFQKILEDPAKAKEMSALVSRQAEQCFSLEKAIGQLKACLGRKGQQPHG